MEKCAVLLSGGVDGRNNFERYKNDLEWIYKVLVEDGEYHRDNIDIFYADGKYLMYEGQKVFSQKAMRDDFVKYLNNKANQLTEEDVFTLVVSNHGGKQDGGIIYLWGTEILKLEELVEVLNQIKAKKNIILGQCYAGNILEHTIDNACVITANEKDSVSFAHPMEQKYDEFLLHFFSYIHGAYPDGTLIGERRMEVAKAYQYAKDKDIFHPDNPEGKRLSEITGRALREIPQIKITIAEAAVI